MKHASKVIFCIAGVLLALGLLLTGASLISGGSLEHIRGNAGATDVSVSFAEEEITSIDVDLPAGLVVFREGQSFGVAAENVASAYFTCEVENGVLTVREAWPGAPNMQAARALSAEKDWPRIVIFIPADAAPVSASVGIRLGSFFSQNVALSGLTADVASGLIDVQVPGAVGSYDVSCKIGLGKLTVGNDWFRGSYKYNSINPAGTRLDLRCGNGEILLGFAG
jgi:hypothetical protein